MRSLLLLCCHYFNSLQLQQTYIQGDPHKTSLYYKNLTTKVGQNKDLVLLQEKVVIQAVCVRTQAVSIKARF